jgi:hypothetical protein
VRTLLFALPDLQPEAERGREVKPFFPETSPEHRAAERAQLRKLGMFLLRNLSTLLLLGAMIACAIAENWEAANLIMLLLLWLKIDDIRVQITVEKGGK